MPTSNHLLDCLICFVFRRNPSALKGNPSSFQLYYPFLCRSQLSLSGDTLFAGLSSGPSLVVSLLPLVPNIRRSHVLDCDPSAQLAPDRFALVSAGHCSRFSYPLCASTVFRRLRCLSLHPFRLASAKASNLKGATYLTLFISHI